MAAEYFFPEVTVIEVEGKDSRRYLNARLSNNIAALSPGQNIPAAALNHQGKPLGLFQVYQHSENLFYLISEGKQSEKTLPALLQFKVADRVDAKYREDLKVVHLLGVEDDSIRSDSLAMQVSRLASRGLDIIAPDPEKDLPEGAVQLSEDEVYKQRVLAGRPVFPAEIDPSKILLESGAQEAVSFRKGCYVGQEVLEKIDSHGKAPSQLISCVCEAELKTGEEILDADKKICGKVISTLWIPSESKSYAFIRVKNRGENAKEGTLTNSGSCPIHPVSADRAFS